MPNEIKQPVVIQISKEEVLNCNIDRLVAILDSFVPDLCDRNRNRVKFEVTGYMNDSRELYDISEVKKYFRHFFDNYHGLFYWINVNSYMFVWMGLMLFTPIRVGGKVTISPEELQEFLSAGFKKLNVYCKENGLSNEPLACSPKTVPIKVRV